MRILRFGDLGWMCLYLSCERDAEIIDQCGEVINWNEEE